MNVVRIEVFSIREGKRVGQERVLCARTYDAKLSILQNKGPGYLVGYAGTLEEPKEVVAWECLDGACLMHVHVLEGCMPVDKDPALHKYGL